MARTGARNVLLCTSILAFALNTHAIPRLARVGTTTSNATQKDAFIDSIVQQMTVTDLVLQMHLMFGDNIVGPESNNELYDYAMRFSPSSPVGNMHDWYPMNKSHYNSVQQLNLQKAHLRIPFIHFAECLHGVGSFNQTMFPQNLGMAASFDTDIVHRAARAIGTEARSIGIHACLSPVLDLAQDPRWGRAQENFGEDKVLTSHMGVAYASGLSKNSSWSEPDAVIPVMKHFAAHGSPQSGHNTAPFMGRGNRQVIADLLTPFKAAVQLGGARGVMMAYSEVDDIPCPVSPILYQALQDWGYDGFVIADDTGMRELESVHQVAANASDAIGQWFNAGGMIQYYDYSLDIFLNATNELVENGTVSLDTLKSHVRRILGVKWDLGLFNDSLIPDSIDPYALVDSHTDIALEAAHKSIVLLENKNLTLPVQIESQSISKIALVGPFGDILNYGDYSGQWGSYPVRHASTIRQGILEYLSKQNSSTKLVSSWGANTWQYNNQYAIPSYHLSTNGTKGGLQATYYANINFTSPATKKIETPVLDWGLYPPPGLPSNNFSVVWEGRLESPTDTEVNGWIGVAISYNSTVDLYVDDELVYHSDSSKTGTVITNIEPFSYIQVNNTLPPPESAPFTFQPNTSYHIRIEFATHNSYQKLENQNSLNAQAIFFWNLVGANNDSITQTRDIASDADLIILTLGDAWNSDGENGDRGTLDLAHDQVHLADAILSLNKPVITVLQGARPFAIPDIYNRSSAVLSTYFPGQAGGQAIAETIFGVFNPGGRLPMTIPRHIGQLPVYYNYKPTAHLVPYLDIDSTPSYTFGYGKSYTTFSVNGFSASASRNSTFSAGDTIVFSATVTNNGSMAGSYVAQVYALQRVSRIVQPVKQLVAFTRAYLDAGESKIATMELDVDRYLMILNRKNEWELEKGEYTFALLEHGGWDADTGVNVTMRCI